MNKIRIAYVRLLRWLLRDCMTVQVNNDGYAVGFECNGKR